MGAGRLDSVPGAGRFLLCAMCRALNTLCAVVYVPVVRFTFFIKFFAYCLLVVCVFSTIYCLLSIIYYLLSTIYCLLPCFFLLCLRYTIHSRCFPISTVFCLLSALWALRHLPGLLVSTVVRGCTRTYGSCTLFSSTL